MTSEVYLSDPNISSELILVQSDNVDIIFQQVDLPNYLISIDKRMIENQFNFFVNIYEGQSKLPIQEEMKIIYFFGRN